MKIRQGFVSNSSSSSYIIKINENKCQFCGRSSPSIVDEIKKQNHYETQIEYDSKESILGDIECNIKIARKNIEYYTSMEPNAIPHENRGYNVCAGELLNYECESLRMYESEYNRISALEGEIYGISIGYHDEHIQAIFDSGVKDGSIEVIKDYCL